MSIRPFVALAAVLACTASPTLAETPGPLLVDAYEIYCTDVGRAGYMSFGVTYARTLPSHFGSGLAFCRVDMRPTRGPEGDAALGWSHNAASGQTSIWCRAKGREGADAAAHARFELYAIPAGVRDARCSPALEGRLP